MSAFGFNSRLVAGGAKNTVNTTRQVGAQISLALAFFSFIIPSSVLPFSPPLVRRGSQEFLRLSLTKTERFVLPRSELSARAIDPGGLAIGRQRFDLRLSVIHLAPR